MSREKSSTVRATSETPMALVTSLPLPSGVAVENGTAVATKSRSKLFIVSGITTGTVHVDGSPDGTTNWISLGSVTADGKIANDEPWPFVRARISAWTTGTFVVDMVQ